MKKKLLHIRKEMIMENNMDIVEYCRKLRNENPIMFGIFDFDGKGKKAIEWIISTACSQEFELYTKQTFPVEQFSRRDYYEIAFNESEKEILRKSNQMVMILPKMTDYAGDVPRNIDALISLYRAQLSPEVPQRYTDWQEEKLQLLLHIRDSIQEEIIITETTPDIQLDKILKREGFNGPGRIGYLADSFDALSSGNEYADIVLCTDGLSCSIMDLPVHEDGKTICDQKLAYEINRDRGHIRLRIDLEPSLVREWFYSKQYKYFVIEEALQYHSDNVSFFSPAVDKIIDLYLLDAVSGNEWESYIKLIGEALEMVISDGEYLIARELLDLVNTILVDCLQDVSQNYSEYDDYESDDDAKNTYIAHYADWADSIVIPKFSKENTTDITDGIVTAIYNAVSVKKEIFALFPKETSKLLYVIVSLGGLGFELSEKELEIASSYNE